MEIPKVGILLTAGAVEKGGVSPRVEPNLEGKIRALGALVALKEGQIDKLYVVGGAQEFGEPLSAYYERYLKRFTDRFSIDPSLIQRLKGKVDTGSDLERVTKQLPDEELANCVIFSSGFHLEAASLVLRNLGYNPKTEVAELTVRSRSKRHDQVVTSVYNSDFIKQMEDRESKKRQILILDQLPLIGQIRPGLRLLTLLASRARQSEN